MSLRRFLTKIRNAEADQSSMENDRPHSYTSSVTTAPSHTLPGRVSQPENSFTDTTAPSHILPGRASVWHSLTNTLGVEESQIATTDYIYYRIYAEDGAIPSKTPLSACNPFLARIKAKSVPPPRTVKVIKCSIAKVENIKDRESTTLFLSPCSQSPMDDAEKVTILNGTGPGSTPQEPLALVAKLSNSERSALESKRRGGLASEAEPDTMIQYLYYLLYADDYEVPSKVAIDREVPSLGRIRADSVAPPHSLTSMKRCISRAEGNPALVHADLFADTSCDTPLKEEHISILRSDGPGLSPNEPMAIVEVKSASIPDGKYVIKNRAANIHWFTAGFNPIETVHFWLTDDLQFMKTYTFTKWDITNDTDGNIFIRTPPGTSPSWVGAEITGSMVPVPWRLIPADNNFYYLTTNMNHDSQNPRVPTAQDKGVPGCAVHGSMAILKEGDKWQMWEFIPI